MNLLFEAQDAKPPVMPLVFPDVTEQENAEAPGVDGEDAGDAGSAAVERVALVATEEQVEQAREQGREEAAADYARRRREDIEVERSAVTHLCTSFTQERKRYFAEVEGEVVKLALAIAARILQRESAMDPTLLKGVVQVALEKVGDAKGAVLRMNPADAEEWHAAMKHSGVEIEGDVRLARGELRLEAAGSVAELGIAAQLVEVERGFFDLLARRPA